MQNSPKPDHTAPLPLLCVPVAQTTPEALIAHSAPLLPDFTFQELRLDYLADPVAALPVLCKYIREQPSAIFLATCRRTESGGRFHGTPHVEREILVQAAAAGCKMVDLSLESAEALGPAALQPLREVGALALLSWHDFERMGDLSAVLNRMRPFAPDFAKLVPTASALTDNLNLLAQLETSSSQPFRLVALCMGEAGAPSRILGLRAGSAFTFAAGTPEEATAPGQITAPVLRDLYRAPALGRASRIYGVAGEPIRSSLSPVMLNTAFRAAGVDASYLPLLTGDAEDLLALARRLPLAGFSVTMPLKQSIFWLLDHVDPLAERIGAVNTVRREQDGSFSGFNTDAAGISVPLRQHLALEGARILVLGAGGAARAAVFACVDAGAKVSIVNRTYSTAATLAGQAGAQAFRPDELRQVPRFDALINATPAGMRQSAAALPLPRGELPADLVFDLVYNPLETDLIRTAREQGKVVLHGVEMFLHQGARQFELWTGMPAPLEAMRQAVMEALG